MKKMKRKGQIGASLKGNLWSGKVGTRGKLKTAGRHD
jgi:hypothetical protein